MTARRNDSNLLPWQGKRRWIPWVVLSLLVHGITIYGLPGFLSHRDPVPETLDVWLLDRNEPKQIVDIPELAPHEKPPNARYLSEHDQRVEKETQAPRTLPNPWHEAT